MITDINRNTLDDIINEHFRKDAERYVLIYERFMEEVRASGIDISGSLSMPEPQYDKLAGISYGNSGHSLYYGEISPACIHCRTGAGSITVFQTLKCNRDCYFCANMNQEMYHHYVENINDVYKELNDADKGAGFRSIALTGGEPLLMPEKAVSFFRFCKEKYPDAYMRLYTNGDFLSDELAKELADSGLNEIRISVKADTDGYPEKTIKAISTASKYIEHPMVEMPVIPGSLNIMKQLLKELEKAGCKGINLLEFLYPWKNNERFREREFKVIGRPYRVFYDYLYAGGLPIAGSSEDCIELLKFASEENLSLSTHYCSLANKLTAQVYGQNSGFSLMPYEVMSDKDHFIKTARAYGSNATKVLKYMKKRNDKGFHSESRGLRVEFHPQHIKSVPGLTEAALTYNIVEKKENSQLLREIKIDLIKPDEFNYSEDV